MHRFRTVVALLCLASDIHAEKGTPALSAYLVSVVDVKDFGAETVRIGDLNGDGAPDLLFAQSTYGDRKITCLTATTILGEVLWQVGAPSGENGRIYSDLPVQVYDWDNDGVNEVLYVRQAVYAEPIYLPNTTITEHARRYEGHAAMVILDGLTGKEKGTFPIPAPADDCFLFADLTGRGRREDLVVKDRYWNIWGVSHEGRELWHWGGSVGHFPAYGDVDNDGRDEVFVGYALLDHDGKVLFEHPSGGAHQDAAYAVRLADGQWRLLFGNGGIHCLTPDGRELWHHPLREAQHVLAGRFRDDSAVQFMAIDRGLRPAPCILHLFDAGGKEIWQRPGPEGSWYGGIVGPLNWSGSSSTREALWYSRGVEPPAVVDGAGEILARLPMQYTVDRGEAVRQEGYYATRADVWGDSRDEVILFGAHGCCIWANSRPLHLPTLYNNTLYPGM